MQRVPDNKVLSASGPYSASMQPYVFVGLDAERVPVL
jgi:hypothetical protein